MILKCTLNPTEIETTKNSWGKIVVSSYHRIINSNAYIFDQDGKLRKGVPKEDIEIIGIEKYVC